MVFQNREEAGELLAQKLKSFAKKNDVLVLGITRGGAVVAKIIAQKLNLVLDIIVVRKIGAPTNPELAIGALGPGKTVCWDKGLLRFLEIGKVQAQGLKLQKEKERTELEKRLRGARLPISVEGKTVILVDDGVATGTTVKCASFFLKKEKARKIILAIPVVSKETFNDIKIYFDSIITLSIEENFYAVGQFYQQFPQVEDEEVIAILNSKK